MDVIDGERRFNSLPFSTVPQILNIAGWFGVVLPVYNVCFNQQFKVFSQTKHLAYVYCCPFDASERGTCRVEKCRQILEELEVKESKDFGGSEVPYFLQCEGEVSARRARLYVKSHAGTRNAHFYKDALIEISFHDPFCIRNIYLRSVPLIPSSSSKWANSIPHSD